MKAGDTFLYPLNQAQKAHLWIVATNPDKEGFVLIVNVTTVRTYDKDSLDTTVCLNKGEHPFFTEEQSYIYYRGAMTKKISEIGE